MKKGEERKEKGINQEDAASLSGSDIGEFGTEYEFFISEETKVKENIANGFRTREPLKKDDNGDQSKVFFLPDFFSDED